MKSTGDSFAEGVYKAAAKIPRGRVATYGQIAKMAGSARAARAVGQLMAKNKNTKKVPCHRVVGSTGALTGYGFGGNSIKRKMLIDEGVSFNAMKVNMKISRWKK